MVISLVSSRNLRRNPRPHVRFDKLSRLIRESGKSIHDLSRTDLSAAGMPRFNMPFELGLYLGATRFAFTRSAQEVNVDHGQ